VVCVIFHWSPGLRLSAAERREILRRFDYICESYEVDDKLYITDEDFGRKHAATLEEALARWSDCTPVYVHPSGNAVVESMEHPNDVVYVFGPDYLPFTPPARAVVARIGSLGNHECWADQAAAIVLHERYRAT